jgi:hypothetical protein
MNVLSSLNLPNSFAEPPKEPFADNPGFHTSSRVNYLSSAVTVVAFLKEY